MQSIIKTEQNLPVELVDVAKSYIEQSTSSAKRTHWTLKSFASGACCTMSPLYRHRRMLSHVTVQIPKNT